MDALTDIILPLAASPWIYPIALGLVILDGFFPLFPSEAVIVGLSALAASTGVPSVLPMILTAALGAVLADSATYASGRTLGRRRIESLPVKPMHRLLGWAEHSLAHRPTILVLVARFIPWARLAVNLSAGALAFPYRRYAPLCVLASCLWAVYNVTMGYLAGQWFSENPLLGMAIAVVFAIAMGIVLDALVNRLRKRTNLGV